MTFPQHQFLATDLSCIRGDRALFADLTLALRAGDVLQVRGANGSGKSTLMRILSGLLQPDSGNILFDNMAITNADSLFSHQLHYLGHLPGVKLDLTPWENLLIAAALANGAHETAINEALDAVQLFGFEHEPARNLSAGQKRRIALARLLVSPLPIWFLDEPFTALDTAGCRLVERLIVEQAARGGMVIFASHTEVQLSCALRSVELLT